MMKAISFLGAVVSGIVLMLTNIAIAENVDLSTVADRNSLKLTIYNSADLTLVQETRKVTFKQGNNPLQFSWSETLIDPTSVELRFVNHADKLTVVDTTFPQARPQVLYWNVASEVDGEAEVEISYFTSGISWTADYVCIADAEEKKVSLDGFVRVQNQSGEEYEDATIRLVVGQINLVQAIAELAVAQGVPVDQLHTEFAGAKELKSTENRAVRLTMRRSSGKRDESGAVEKEIAKEGLSEYFIYSIEGTESIANGWSKRMRSLKGANIPLRVQYRYRPQQYGEELVRMFLLKNDVPSGLGTSPLPDGQVKIFADNGRDGLSFLAQQTIPYVPVGDQMELNLGADPSVIFQLVKMKSSREKIWLQLGKSKELRLVGGDNGRIQRESATVVGWDDREVYEQRVRNFTSRPIDVEMRRTFPGDVVFRSALQPTLHDFQTVEFLTKVAPAEKKALAFEIIRHQGTSSKQNHVVLAESPNAAAK